MGETSREIIDKVKEQYELYTKAVEPYRDKLKENGIVNQKENEIFKVLLHRYLKEYDIKYTEKDSSIYLILQGEGVEVFIAQGTMHISNIERDKKYFMHLSLEIQNIFNNYFSMFLESIDDKLPHMISELYDRTITGRLTDIQMMEFINKMQTNLLTLNREKHYLMEHSSPEDYEYTLSDTVETDEKGNPIRYSDFGIAWQMTKNRIDAKQYYC